MSTAQVASIGGSVVGTASATIPSSRENKTGFAHGDQIPSAGAQASNTSCLVIVSIPYLPVTNTATSTAEKSINGVRPNRPYIPAALPLTVYTPMHG